MYKCIRVYMYTCIYVYMHICIYVYMNICMYVYMYICIHVNMYVCIYVYFWKVCPLLYVLHKMTTHCNILQHTATQISPLLNVLHKMTKELNFEYEKSAHYEMCCICWCDIFVAVCCSVLQCVAEYRSVLLCVK